MKGRFLRGMGRWVERGRGAGVFLLVVALCAGLGLLIALPLWAFATREPRAYTIVALSLLAGGLVFLVARAVYRKMRRNAGRNGQSLLSGTLTVLMSLVTVAGLYLLAVGVSRGVWILTGVTAAVLGLLLWLLGAARAAARKSRKRPPIPAENRSR